MGTIIKKTLESIQVNNLNFFAITIPPCTTHPDLSKFLITLHHTTSLVYRTIIPTSNKNISRSEITAINTNVTEKFSMHQRMGNE